MRANVKAIHPVRQEVEKAPKTTESIACHGEGVPEPGTPLASALIKLKWKRLVLIQDQSSFETRKLLHPSMMDRTLMTLRQASQTV